MNNPELSFSTDYSLFEELISKLVLWTPYLIGLIVYVIVAYLLFKLIIMLFSKLLDRIKPEDALKKWLPSLELDDIKINFSSIILAFLKITLLLLLVVFGSELFGLEIISAQISILIGYLPRVLVSIALIIIALGLSASVSKFLINLFQSLNISGAKLLARIISSILLFVIVIIAIELVGIDTSIITTNISIILGAMMISIAIALGLGSVELVRRILFGFYFKKNYKIGQIIQMEDIKGRIVAIDGISVVVKGANETYIIPIKELVDNRVSILED